MTMLHLIMTIVPLVDEVIKSIPVMITSLVRHESQQGFRILN
jgi:hypothetical protein